MKTNMRDQIIRKILMINKCLRNKLKRRRTLLGNLKGPKSRTRLKGPFRFWPIIQVWLKKKKKYHRRHKISRKLTIISIDQMRLVTIIAGSRQADKRLHKILKVSISLTHLQALKTPSDLWNKSCSLQRKLLNNTQNRSFLRQMNLSTKKQLINRLNLNSKRRRCQGKRHLKRQSESSLI